MNPQLISLIIQLVELAIQEEPAIALELHQIFTTPNPSAADWQALREKVLSENFESLAPNAAANLPPENVTSSAETVTDQSQVAAVASPDAPDPALAAAPKLRPRSGTPV
jgi:hypothetical protein